MENKQWLRSNISTPAAEKLLLEKGVDGSFLVRPSTTSPGIFTLSARLNGKVTHIRVRNTGDYYDLYAGKFATLAEIVEYYTRKDDPTDGDISEPRYPLYSTDPSNERWFHGDMSGRKAESLLKDAEKGSFLVRPSQSIPGDFALSVKAEDNVTHIKIKSHEGKFGFDERTELYDTLSELIDICLPVCVTDGGVICFTEPLNTTKIKVSDIDNRVKTLEKMAYRNNSEKTGFWREFEQLQYQEWKNVHNRKDGHKAENIAKNRYANILPFDQTRVFLRLGDPNVEGCDYINASIVKNPKDDSAHLSYIATQGCLQHTVQDFWHMVWQEDCSIIVMLTKLYERDQDICIKYWPDENNDKKEINLYREKIIIKYLNEINTAEFVIRAFELCKEGDDYDARIVYQYQFTAWPDQGVPQDPRGLLEIVQQIAEKQESLLADDGRHQPIIVHCCGGIGRTGTFIVIDMIIKKIKTHGLDCVVDIPGIIQMVRAQRSGMVQTEAQYKLVYTAVQHYVKNLQQEMQTEEGVQKETLSGSDKSTGNLHVDKSELKSMQTAHSPACGPVYQNLPTNQNEPIYENYLNPPAPPVPPRKK